MLNRTTAARLGAATGAGMLVVLSAAAPTSAHVTITPSDAEAGAYTVLTFSVGHGCEGSPTTALDIQVPEPILSVTPTLLTGWQVEKQMVVLDEPVEDAHGNSVTERVGVVSYTADEPLADGYRAAMELSLQLPATPGETLVFPVVQRCAEGETAWTEVAADGQDPEELAHPAPTVAIVAETADGGTVTASGSPSTRTVEVESDTNVALGLAGLAAGLIGLVVAMVALGRSRRDT